MFSYKNQKEKRIIVLEFEVERFSNCVFYKILFILFQGIFHLLDVKSLFNVLACIQRLKGALKMSYVD